MGFFCGPCVIYVLCLPCFRVCPLLPCGHLLGKDWPLGSCLWCLIVILSLSYVVSWVRCGTWLYWFLIFAVFPTLIGAGLSAHCACVYKRKTDVPLFFDCQNDFLPTVVNSESKWVPTKSHAPSELTLAWTSIQSGPLCYHKPLASYMYARVWLLADILHYFQHNPLFRYSWNIAVLLPKCNC